MSQLMSQLALLQSMIIFSEPDIHMSVNHVTTPIENTASVFR